MSELRHTFTVNAPFQAANTTLEWTWPVGEREHYWGYSIRPFQANESGLEVLRQWTTTDNDLRATEHFLVKAASGGLMRFSAIWVVG